MASRLALMLLLVGLVGQTSVWTQQTPPPPSVKPFVDGADWILLESLTYRIGTTNYQVIVPKGFVTDFSSIPAAFRAFVLPTGRSGRAGIIHDYLYWIQACSREQADRIFLLAMIESGVDLVTRYAMYGAVRAGGLKAWNLNEADRKTGLPRIIPDAWMNLPALARWPDYRQELFKNKVAAEAKLSPIPDYCAASETLNVDVP
jgi:hypothetical protein